MTTRAGLTTEQIEVGGTFAENLLKAPILMFTDNAVEPRIFRAGMIVAAATGFIGGSVLARKRAAEGKRPILGVLA